LTDTGKGLEFVLSCRWTWQWNLHTYHCCGRYTKTCCQL